MAETVASWQKGVKGISNEIEVLPPEKARSDKNLETVLKQIRKYQFPLSENVSISVTDGVVTLNEKFILVDVYCCNGCHLCCSPDGFWH